MHARPGFRHPEIHLEAVRIAGLGQQAPGRGRIVGVLPHRGVGRPRAGQERADGRDPGALQDVADDGLLVHGVVEGLPHALVGERLLVDVEADVPHREAGLLVHGHLRRLLQLLDEVGGDRQDQVDAAGQQLGHAGRRIRDRAVHERLRPALAPPVIVVALEDQAAAAFPRIEPVAPAADRP